ncbi:MAG: hypothetical protein STHCBS139747_005363 [Sporothrix thermara]
MATKERERKIDQFEARLAGIEGLLQDMSSRLPGRVDDRKTDHDGIAAGMRTYTSPSGLSTANTAYEEQPSALSAPENVAKHTRMHMYNTAETPSVSSVGGDDPLQFDGAASFEGTSSMAAQTAYASDFVEQALTGNTPMQTNASAHPYMGGDGALAAQPDMQKALAALRKMAQQQQQQQEHRGSQQPARSPSSHFSRQKPVPRGGVCHLPLPPTDVVLKLLREIRVTPPMAFNMSCSFLFVDDFVEACRDVYFATEDFGLSRFIVVNGGLYYLFEEKATYAIENSKFTLAWQLNSAAAAMCQTLGWHHATTPESASSPDRLRPGAFWFCYMIDKGLALRFGRTCMLPDWDISTPREFFHGKSGSRDKINDNRPVNNPENQDPGALHNIFNVWIRTGAVLGQTYEHLYSPAALARSPQERTDTATRLGTATKQIWSDFEKLSSTALHGEIPRGHADPGHANVDDWRQATLKRVLLSGEVGHLATLTLIYRAIPHAKPPSKEAPSSSSLSTELPNSSLHAECVSAARGAFRSHLECMALASDDPLAQVGHLHWTVLYSPFTPLIVLFCHVIETASRLRRAKASLVEEEITTDLAHLEAL